MRLRVVHKKRLYYIEEFSETETPQWSILSEGCADPSYSDAEEAIDRAKYLVEYEQVSNKPENNRGVIWDSADGQSEPASPNAILASEYRGDRVVSFFDAKDSKGIDFYVCPDGLVQAWRDDGKTSAVLFTTTGSTMRDVVDKIDAEFVRRTPQPSVKSTPQEEKFDSEELRSLKNRLEVGFMGKVGPSAIAEAGKFQLYLNVLWEKYPLWYVDKDRRNSSKRSGICWILDITKRVQQIKENRMSDTSTEDVEFLIESVEHFWIVIQQLIKERDEWKFKVEQSAKVIEDADGIAMRLAKKYGDEIAEANRLLYLIFNTPSVAPVPWGTELTDQVQKHLQRYKPYQK